MKICCFSRLQTLWCLLVVFGTFSFVQLCLWLSTDSHTVTTYVSNFPKRSADISLCPLADTRKINLISKGKVPFYKCKSLRKKGLLHILDPKKFVFARYLTEVNGTTIEESNRLNLIANAIDLKAYVIHETSMLTSQCVISTNNKPECSCSCLGDSSNCSTTLSTVPFNSKCIQRPTPQLYTSEQFQKVLCDNGLPRLMTIDAFLHNSYRDIVFVHPVYKINPSHLLSEEERLIQERLRTESPIIDCRDYLSVYNTTRDILNDINDLANLFCISQFRIKNCYCIAAWYKNNDLGMYWFADEKVSVVFTSWAGMDHDDSDILIPYTESEPSEPKGGGEDQQAGGAKSKENGQQSRIVRRRHHSSLAKMVLQQTKKFIKAMAQGRQYIVVHLRVDSFFSGYSQRTDFNLYYQSCLFKLKSNLDRLKLEHSDASVFFFMDSTNDIDIDTKDNSSVGIQLRLIKTVLLGSKYEVQHYSPEQYGGRSDMPFVTLVEQEFMCRASYLLTVGGGQIQDRLKKRFLKMHFRKKLLDFQYCDVDPLNTGPLPGV